MARTNAGSGKRQTAARSSKHPTASDRPPKKARQPTLLDNIFGRSVNVALVCLVLLIAVIYSVYRGSERSHEKPPSPASGAERPGGRGNKKSPKKDAAWRKHILTPQFVAELIERHYSDELSRNVQRAKLDRQHHLEKGKGHAKRGEWHNATRQFRHILEHDPFDEEAERFLHACFRNMYPTGPDGHRTINFTEQFFSVLNQRLCQRWMVVHNRNISIHQVHPKIKAYVLENFLSEAECAGFINEHDRIAQEYGVYPLICFQNNRFLKHPHLKHLYIPGTYCLNQAASRAVGPHLNWSTSAGCHRGESGLAYHIEKRVEEAVGLPEEHGFNTQLLSYLAGVSYNDHTDCDPDTCNIMKTERVATFLAYLTSTEGGELSFPRLGVSIKPACGRAVVFYSFTPEGCCDSNTMHRSDVVLSGKSTRKMVIQKWYTYPNVPYLAERHQPPLVRERLPYQPVVSCDYILDGAESSCRWYDFWPFKYVPENTL